MGMAPMMPPMQMPTNLTPEQQTMYLQQLVFMQQQQMQQVYN